MTKINKEEYQILKEDSKEGYEWIARDKSNSLYTYEGEMIKATNIWCSRGFKPVINSNLFQFIQWEDREPYSIAELIEEYEKEYHIKNAQIVNIDAADITGSIHRFKDSDESEETELKRNLKEAILGIEVTQFDGQKADLEELVNPKQLEKIISDWTPEVLSEEFGLRKYQEGYEQGRVDRIAELISDESVTINHNPTIPRFVADWIERERDRYGNSLLLIGNDFYSNVLQRDVDDWLMDNEEKFVRAWLDGYTVEKELKYRARLKVITDEFISSYLRTQSSNAEDRLKALEIGSKYIHEDYRHLSEFTEDELKRLDIWDSEQWEIEELEE